MRWREPLTVNNEYAEAYEAVNEARFGMEAGNFIFLGAQRVAYLSALARPCK
jgi:hypothetical protein